ncbi:uncharacterized protein LOC114242467 [Bombyx mandarina]|uniref:Uncharacterized protein LOC114242467 n=1 Tax=Bombyx mandarina TaxID=7092 RepID=A0A6J2JK84_BOMMA|nr:uncharacterized protein LOC114242467 [Bombyx mandarina]
MSQVFHKACYTSRIPKCRTLSTNTDHNKQNTDEDTYDRKIEELKLEVSEKIDKEIDRAKTSRQSILEKFNKIDSKIDSMLEIQDKVTALRKDLHTAEYTLSELTAKIAKIELASSSSDGFSLHSKNMSFRSKEPIIEELEYHNIQTRKYLRHKQLRYYINTKITNKAG